MDKPNFTFILLTVILLLATYTDVKKHLIPNVLSIGGIFIGLAIHSYQTGFDGFLFSISGLAVGFFLLLPFYMLRGMAAGDVKLMAAIGSFMGPAITLAAVGGTLVSGTLLAIIYIIVKGGGALTLKRYATIIHTFYVTHKLIYIKPSSQDIANLQFPYASAILVGTFSGVYITTNTIPFYI